MKTYTIAPVDDLRKMLATRFARGARTPSTPVTPTQPVPAWLPVLPRFTKSPALRGSFYQAIPVESAGLLVIKNVRCPEYPVVLGPDEISLGTRFLSNRRGGISIHQARFPMPSSIARKRTHAFMQQHGLCFYCRQPMWSVAPQVFAQRYGLTRRQATYYQSTAEHLHAKCDGGGDAQTNIVAACRCCNSRRHARKKPQAPDQYRSYVQKRMDKGRWHVAQPHF